MVSKEPIKIPDIPKRRYKQHRAKPHNCKSYSFTANDAQALIDVSQEFLNRGNPKNERDWI